MTCKRLTLTQVPRVCSRVAEKASGETSVQLFSALHAFLGVCACGDECIEGPWHAEHEEPAVDTVRKPLAAESLILFLYLIQESSDRENIQKKKKSGIN